MLGSLKDTLSKVIHRSNYLAFSLVLSGCTAVVTRLPDGYFSTMGSFANIDRSQVSSPQPESLRIRHKPTSAPVHYKMTARKVGGAFLSTDYDLDVKQVEDSFLLTLSQQNMQNIVSTVLISIDGRLLDYNWHSFIADSTEKNRTPENYATNAEKAKSHIPTFADGLNGLIAINPHTINEVSVIFPTYLKTEQITNDTVAYVVSDDGKIWASYSYRGVVEIQGQKGALFDLLRVRGDLASEPVIVGFNIIDIDDGLPILCDFSSGSEFQFRRAF
jgi:hypothetical protein